MSDIDDRLDVIWYHLHNVWILLGHGDISVDEFLKKQPQVQIGHNSPVYHLASAMRHLLILNEKVIRESSSD